MCLLLLLIAMVFGLCLACICSHFINYLWLCMILDGTKKNRRNDLIYKICNASGNWHRWRAERVKIEPSSNNLAHNNVSVIVHAVMVLDECLAYMCSHFKNYISLCMIVRWNWELNLIQTKRMICCMRIGLI